MNDAESVPITVSLPPDLLAKLDQLCSDWQVTRDEEIKRALTGYLWNYKSPGASSEDQGGGERSLPPLWSFHPGFG